jgi:hypothetical protein
MVSFALLPLESVGSKLTVVVSLSASWETVGESEMTLPSAETVVEWMVISFVLRAIEVLSSLTSRLGVC